MNALVRCVNRDLKKLMIAQVKAEILGESEFRCPVCGGRAVWNRENSGGQMSCCCHGCGMYLHGSARNEGRRG